MDQLIVEAGGIPTVTHGHKMPQISNYRFAKVDSSQLIAKLSSKGVYVSAGSACSSGTVSSVLLSMGFSEQQASSAVRFSLSRFSTESEVREAIQCLKSSLAEI
jgi:cysteine desulfurase